MRTAFDLLSFWILWIIACIAGLALGLFLVGIVISAKPTTENSGIASLLAGIAFGSGLGVVQWLSLRGTLRYAATWVPASVVGYSASFIIVWGLDTVLDNKLWTADTPLAIAIAALTICATIGISVGIPQAMSLFTKGMLALLWIPVHSLGVLTAFAVAYVSTRIAGYWANIEGWRLLALLLIFGGLYGGITGMPLAIALKLNLSYPRDMNFQIGNRVPRITYQ